MIESESTVREWGRSLGVVIPKELADSESLKPGDSIRIAITRKNDALAKNFGKFKLKRKTDEILKEIDEEGWDL
ncbi:MAG: AbrB/MazE/SpoVT family DNA-binding domain-containing protein [Nanoarchaeota archaeon]